MHISSQQPTNYYDLPTIIHTKNQRFEWCIDIRRYLYNISTAPTHKYTLSRTLINTCTEHTHIDTYIIRRSALPVISSRLRV